MQIKKENNQSLLNPNSHKVEVQEFIQTTTYTYFKVVEGNAEYWMAAPKRETKQGETLYYSVAYEMVDFKSTELGKTFDLVYFIQDLSSTPPTQTGAPAGESQVHMGTPRDQNPIIKNDGPGEVAGEVEEEISIHELITNMEKYANKLVKVSGKVIKVNPAIMARNWVHITPEPSDGHNHDLTLTTQEEVLVDQVISVQGQVSIDRDFGAGYTYKIIIENARLISK